MKRNLEVGVFVDEDGTVTLDTEDAANKLLFLLQCLENFGGGFTAVALRDQVGDDEFVPAGLRIQYESFVPARRVQQEPSRAPEPIEEGALAEEPVAA